MARERKQCFTVVELWLSLSFWNLSDEQLSTSVLDAHRLVSRAVVEFTIYNFYNFLKKGELNFYVSLSRRSRSSFDVSIHFNVSFRHRVKVFVIKVLFT